MAADGLTKALQATKFKEFRDLVGLLKITDDDEDSAKNKNGPNSKNSLNDENGLYSKDSSSDGGAASNARRTDLTEDFD